MPDRQGYRFGSRMSRFSRLDDHVGSRAVLSAGQIMDPDSLRALRVNGADLSADHGYPPG